MSDIAANFDLHRRDKGHVRRTASPAYLPGAVDPLLTRKPTTMSPGSMIVIAMVVVVLCTTGNSVYQLCQKYNDTIVSAMLYALPFVAGFGALVILRVAILWRRNERRLIAYEKSMRQSSSQLVKDFQAESGVRKISRPGVTYSARTFSASSATSVAASPAVKQTPTRAEDLDPGLRRLPLNRTVPKIQRRRVQLPGHPLQTA